MMKYLASIFSYGSMLCLAGAGSVGAADLSAGSTAPDFELPGSDGNTYQLADIDNVVVLAWYPKAFTGG